MSRGMDHLLHLPYSSTPEQPPGETIGREPRPESQVVSNDNVDDAGLKNTFAIDVPAVHATAAKLAGLDFHDRI